MPSFLTVRDVAAELRISVRQAHRLLDEGRLPSCRIGRLRRIPADAFARYLSALKQDAAADQRERQAPVAWLYRAPTG